MIGGISASLSGLLASTRQVNNTASNIANLQSTSTLKDGQLINEPFIPNQIVNVSQEGGGVYSVSVPLTNPTVPLYVPGSILANEQGLVDYPNVNIATEVTNLIVAEQSYKSNINALETIKETLDILLDEIG
ncbi:MAG: hypothetical protein MK137_07680 [Rickettsiales bacterium]|nr:hypothetical protein [Rickettsiales bacterium]